VSAFQPDASATVDLAEWQGALDCPIFQELGHIFRHAIRTHVILIDDARCFGSEADEADYPSIDELQQFVLANNPALSLTVQYDCICLTPTANS